MLVGMALVPNCWLLLIGVHLVIMTLLPWILNKLSDDFYYVDYYHSYGGDDLKGLLVGALWAGVMVAIYWLCCT